MITQIYTNFVYLGEIKMVYKIPYTRPTRNILVQTKNQLATLEILYTDTRLTAQKFKERMKKNGIRSNKTQYKYIGWAVKNGYATHSYNKYEITEKGITELPNLREKIIQEQKIKKRKVNIGLATVRVHVNDPIEDIPISGIQREIAVFPNYIQAKEEAKERLKTLVRRFAQTLPDNVEEAELRIIAVREKKIEKEETL